MVWGWGRRAPVDADELVGAAASPPGELDVVDGGAGVCSAEVEALRVAEEGRVVVELRHHLLDVAAVLEDLRPRPRQAREQPVCVVETPALHQPCPVQNNSHSTLASHRA